jgi:curved DNA-binding protein CbpA
MGFMMLLWLSLVASIPSIHAQQYQAPPPSSCDNPAKSPKYAWEAWNSYEILGLEDPTSSFSLSSSALQKRQEHRTTLTHKDIRKAYRKQAQQWHPDKINNNNSNNNSTSTSTGPTTMISMEESNARFARINEAQTVLSNPEAKLEYDNYLRYCEASNQQQSSSSTSMKRRYNDYSDWASSLFSHFSTPRNPFDMFEEYFFGSGVGPTTYNDDHNDDDYSQYDSYFYGNQQQERQRQSQHAYGRPVRVYESQDIVYHASLGREVVRVTHTEEYAADRNEDDGRFYYCVMAQDFLQVYDPHRGGFVLQPVTQQPYLLEEGWKSRPSQGRTKFTPPPPRQQQQQQQNQQQQYSPKQDHYAFQSSNTILVGDILTPNSPLLTSPNGRYYAGLSPNCQLLIFSDKSSSGKNKQQQQARDGSDDSEDDKDDDLIWSSPQLSPQLQQQQRQQHTQGQCFVMLRDNHLIVALGTPERPSHLLWYSDPDPRGPQSQQQQGGNTKKYTSSQDSLDPIYMAQLDNDGSLAVYRIETVPQVTHEYFHTNDEGDKDAEPKTPWTHFVSAALFGYPPRTKAAKAWVATRQWVVSLVLAREYSGQFVRHKTCIHATGPMGCFRSARRLHQFARDGTFHVHRIVTKLDHALDQIITFLVQDDSDDDDDETIYHRVFSRSNTDESDKEDLLDRVWRKLYELKEETTLWARQGVRVVREKFLDRLQAAGFP